MGFNLAPGHILQFNHLKRRLKADPKQTFLEFGAGNGMTSNILLQLGMSGVAYDRNSEACEKNRRLNAEYIANGVYEVINSDFLFSVSSWKVDIVISCMVLEHLNEEELKKFFQCAKQVLNPGGKIISLVPGSSRHWGIEDMIAGHLRRYGREDFDELASENGLTSSHTVGLTYPLSNLLLPLSNFLVQRAEQKKMNLNLTERTIESGNRNVPFKTTFPGFFRFLVNEITLSPLILAQWAFQDHPHCLVLYNEMEIS